MFVIKLRIINLNMTFKFQIEIELMLSKNFLLFLGLVEAKLLKLHLVEWSEPLHLDFGQLPLGNFSPSFSENRVHLQSEKD